MAHTVDVAFQRLIVLDAHQLGKLLVLPYIGIAMPYTPFSGRRFIHETSQHIALQLLGRSGIFVNLLYTAVTRAKKMVVLVGRKDIPSKMVSNNREILRYTTLKDKICYYI